MKSASRPALWQTCGSSKGSQQYFSPKAMLVPPACAPNSRAATIQEQLVREIHSPSSVSTGRSRMAADIVSGCMPASVPPRPASITWQLLIIQLSQSRRGAAGHSRGVRGIPKPTSPPRYSYGRSPERRADAEVANLLRASEIVWACTMQRC